MELDDLKTAWESQSRALDKSLTLNTVLLTRANLERVQRRIGTTQRGIIVQLVIDAFAVLLIGSFAGNHASDVRYLIPALLLGAFALVLIADAVGQLVVIRTVDYDEAVVTIQERLLRLRARRLKRLAWILAFAPLMWPPLAIVAVRGFFGVDVYQVLGTPYILANVGLGLLVLVLAAFLARRRTNWSERYAFVKSFLDDVCGRSLAEALDSLDSLQRFAAEDAAV